jgi:hypothetical protein
MSGMQAQDEAVDLADDFLESLGLSTGEMTPEDRVMDYLTEGSSRRIDTFKYELRHHMEMYQFLLEKNINITKNLLKDGRAQAVQLTKTEYAKIHLHYYLLMQHCPMFMDLTNRPAAKIETIVDQIVALDDMKEIIEKDRS